MYYLIVFAVMPLNFPHDVFLDYYSRAREQGYAYVNCL